MQSDLEKRLAAVADREEIRDLVRRERFARDQRHWEVMRDCFHDEARIRTTWFDGDAVRYVNETRINMSGTNNGKHWVLPGFLRINGDRATIESPAMIFNRIVLEGVEVDFYVYCRFFSRVLRREGTWRLLSFEVIFERDIMSPVDPRDPMPIDWDRLATYRPSYRFLTYVQEFRGRRVSPDLYGDDRREALQAFHDAETLWLGGGEP